MRQLTQHYYSSTERVNATDRFGSEQSPLSPSVPAAAAAFAQQQQGALSSGPGVDGPPDGVDGDARYARGLLVEIARSTCEVSTGSQATFMLHQVLAVQERSYVLFSYTRIGRRRLSAAPPSMIVA